MWFRWTAGRSFKFYIRVKEKRGYENDMMPAIAVKLKAWITEWQVSLIKGGNLYANDRV